MNYGRGDGFGELKGEGVHCVHAGRAFSYTRVGGCLPAVVAHMKGRMGSEEGKSKEETKPEASALGASLSVSKRRKIIFACRNETILSEFWRKLPSLI